VPKSFLSLFQIVTLDHWCSTLVRPLVARYPSFIILFVPFLAATVLSLLNVIVSVIIETTLASAAVDEEKRARELAKVNQMIMASLKDVFEAADTDGSGELDKTELKEAWKLPHVRDRMKMLQLGYKDLEELFDILDEANNTGNINTKAFFRGCTRLRGNAMACDLQHMSVDFSRYAVWAENLGKTHMQVNDQLASLLADVEGLDRDVVKGKQDDDDPVLVNRRHRFKRMMHAQYANIDLSENGLHSKERVSVDSTFTYQSDGFADHFQEEVVDYGHEHHEYGSRQGSKRSLVARAIQTTNIGVDFNQLRAQHGVARRPSFQEEYDEDRSHVQQPQRKPANTRMIEDSGSKVRHR